MKKEIIFSIFGLIFILGLTFYFTKSYQQEQAQLDLFRQNFSNSNPTDTNLPANGTDKQTNKIDTGTNSGAQINLDAATVAGHNSASDCWFIVNGGVYNVTGYINIHPGGRNDMIRYCGQDATTAFLTQGGQGSHSSRASADLSQLYIGNLNATVNSQTVETVKQNTTLNNFTNTPNSFNGGEYEDEYENEYEDD